ncbi:hypothetical protein PFISCL1PPCAC_17864, partial [Pristionchus fissidentatus]
MRNVNVSLKWISASNPAVLRFDRQILEALPQVANLTLCSLTSDFGNMTGNTAMIDIATYRQLQSTQHTIYIEDRNMNKQVVYEAFKV